MELTVKEKTYTLEYTFNSFKYMEDLNFAEMQTIDESPFKIIKILKILIGGAINHDRKQPVISRVACEELIEDFVDDGGDIIELFQNLTTMLTDTGFFKSLQKKAQTV